MGETKVNAGRKEAESEKHHVVLPETDAETLAGKPQPCGQTQINRNVLN